MYFHTKVFRKKGRRGEKITLVFAYKVGKGAMEQK